MTTVAVVLVVYFLPTIIGRSRGVTNLGSVFVVNVFLGWTLVGWVVALAMAARTISPAPQRLQEHSADLVRRGAVSDEQPQDPHVLL